MESQAQGCEVIVSGKLRGQRAKAMKFVDGLMIHSVTQLTSTFNRLCDTFNSSRCYWYQGEDNASHDPRVTMSEGHEVSPSNQSTGPTHLIAALSSRGVAPQQSQQIQQGTGGPIRVQLQQQGRATHIVPYPQGGAQPTQQIRTVQQVYQHSPGVPQQRIVHQIAQRPMSQPIMRVSNNQQTTMQIVHTGPAPQPQQIHVSSSPNMSSRPPPPAPPPTAQQATTRPQVAALPGGQPPPPGTNVQQMLAPPSSNGSVMDRTRIDEVTRQISSNTVLDDIVKDVLCTYVEEYVNELVHHVCRLAKHRGNHRIEARGRRTCA
ncbi:Ribosomal protein S3, C-terminal domain [Parelaphostrongylus tenuis]|uniref:Transcription initiation factor TFIID subunit 12 n=1 Tax=Parelaphostrongylus tenuis TaxID=148309 RepID=A0AAD5MUL2_PARTN|nr:Ribosomal protein S3, C-terminal domain [Parelaphostrongylus tenuis]